MLKQIKKIVFIVSILLFTMFNSLNIVNWYSLSTTSYNSYLSSLESDKTILNDYLKFYNDNSLLIEEVFTNYNTWSLLNEMNVLYENAFQDKSIIIQNLESQKAELSTLYATLEDKYQNNLLTLSDYGIIKSKLDILKNQINSAIVDIWNIEEYVWVYTMIIANVWKKELLLETNKTNLIQRQSEYNTKLQNYIDKLEVFKITKTSEDLNTALETLWVAKEHISWDSILSISIKSIKTEIESLNYNLTSIKENIAKFKENLLSLTNIEIVNADITNLLLSEISEKENDKVEIENLYSVLKDSSLVWNRWKFMDSIFKDYLWKVQDIWTTINWTNLQKIKIKLPNSWYLTELNDPLLETNNQNLYKALFSDIKSNPITNEGIEIPSLLTTTLIDRISYNKPIKNLLIFEKSFSINALSDLVIWIDINYNNVNWELKKEVLKGKININDLNLLDVDWNIITSLAWEKELNWIYLQKDQYLVDLKLISRDSKTSLTTVSTWEIPKDLIINITNSNWDTYYSTKILDFKDFLSINIVNLGWLKLNYDSVSDDYSIDYANFSKNNRNKILINNYKINYVWYSSTEYETLMSDIENNYLNISSNVLKLETWRTIWNRVWNVKVKINNEDTTKTITYTLLDWVIWDNVNKIMKPQYKNYTIEKNVIIDPLIKKYFDETKEISFEEKIIDVRNVLSIGNKVEKIIRLKNAAWVPIIEEYRYFDSTQNYNSDIDDTTWQVLIFFKIKEVISEWNHLKWINRIKKVYYKVWLNENYWKVVATKNSDTLITVSWNLDNDYKPEIITVDPLMKYKVFTDYRVYFDKEKYLNWDLKNSIRYTQIYKDDKFSYKVVKFNWIEIWEKGTWLNFLNTSN